MNTDRLPPGSTPPDGREAATPQLPTVRHRTERDASGRVWRFVYDPAAQDALLPAGMARIRCTTGTARTALTVRDDWYEWQRVQLLDELAVALKLGRGQAAGGSGSVARPAAAVEDRAIARRRLVRNVRGQAWNCVYDPACHVQTDGDAAVRVRCSSGRDRLELQLTVGWHRLGDRQLADLIEQALEARPR